MQNKTLEHRSDDLTGRPKKRSASAFNDAGEKQTGGALTPPLEETNGG